MADNLRKWKCCSCDTICVEASLLRAENPFERELVIVGCPKCKEVGCFTEICDESECTRDATCGFPTAGGYRRTCYEHMKAAEKPPEPEKCSVCEGSGEVAGDYFATDGVSPCPACGGKGHGVVSDE